ncbi:MAG: hypothetical protein RLO21_00770 [Nitratireductor sp.]
MEREVYRMLFVEDNEQELERFRRNLGEFNSDETKDIRLELLSANCLEEAFKQLKTQRVDCAMIDLRIPKHAGGIGDGDEANGNAAIESILLGYAMPIVVHSGHLGELDPKIKEANLKEIGKDADAHTAALDWFAGNRTLMRAMAEARKRIRTETAKVFFKAIWQQWQSDDDLARDREQIHATISRQIVSYVAEMLTLENPEVPAFHVREFYFVPPLRERLHTGDLLTIGNDVFVVVTPQCDIANSYPDHLLVARCIELKDELDRLKDKVQKNSGSLSSAVKDQIRKWATQNIGTSRHFLPPCNNRGPWLIDFAAASTLPSDNATKLLKGRFASITPQFIPNLVQRWSAHLGRVGQPNLDEEELARHLLTQ